MRARKSTLGLVMIICSISRRSECGPGCGFQGREEGYGCLHPVRFVELMYGGGGGGGGHECTLSTNSLADAIGTRLCSCIMKKKTFSASITLIQILMKNIKANQGSPLILSQINWICKHK